MLLEFAIRQILPEMARVCNHLGWIGTIHVPSPLNPWYNITNIGSFSGMDSGKV
jgi:hypothetical protein